MNEDITGKRFGNLTTEEKVCDTDDGLDEIWRFKCDCGSECELKKSAVVSGSRKTCGQCKSKDLEDRRFGKLLVLEVTEKTRRHYRLWKCRCDCGNEILITRSELLYGGRTSCGHCRDKDLEGKRFGKLTAVCATGESRNGSRLWKCRCDCGNEIEVTRADLIHNIRRSCGCMRMNLGEDLPGRRFGKLTVTKVLRREKGNVFVECRCDCGNTVETTYTNLLAREHHSCGCDLPERMPEILEKRGNVEGTSLGIIASEKLLSTNKSGVKGVYWQKKTHRWIAQIQFQGRKRHLGCFETLEEAAEARKKAEQELYEPVLQKHSDWVAYNQKKKNRKA